MIFLDAPVLLHTPDAIFYVNKLARLSLTCVVNSNELSEIRWYKDGIQAVNGDGTHLISVWSLDQKVTSTLNVTAATLETVATYTCNATNSLGSDHYSTQVKVLCM